MGIQVLLAIAAVVGFVIVVGVKLAVGSSSVNTSASFKSHWGQWLRDKASSLVCFFQSDG